VTLAPPPIRCAVLGTGAIAQVAHLPILSRMRGITLADRLGVQRVYESADEVWVDPSVDAVVIATPSHLHAEQVCAGLESGKFVFCEKPLALTSADARRVIETPGADERLMVGMNQRFRPDAAALRAFVAGGELGEVHYLRAGWLNRRVAPSRTTWRHRRSGAGGGALMDLGIQLLDLCLWILDYPRPRRLLAHMRRKPGSEVEDSAVVVLELEEGRVINLEVTWDLVSDRDRQYLQLQGTEGSASLPPLRVLKEMESGVADVSPTAPPGRENLFTASYRQELTVFCGAVRGEVELSAPAEQVTLLSVVEAAYRSADGRTEITF
jgi:predicted dehydrogenase